MKFKRFMKEIREKAVSMGIPAIPESTGKFLSFLTYTLAKSRNYLNLVELGAGIGYSALWMFYGILKSNKKCKIHAVEREKDIFKEIDKILNKAQESIGINLDNFIKFHLKDAEDLKGDEFGKIDLLFLDINKKGYYPTLLKFYKNIKKDGVIVAHNVFSHREELKDFIAEIENEDKYITFFIETDPQGISVSFKK